MRKRLGKREEPSAASTPQSTVKIQHDIVNEQLLIVAAATDWDGRGGALVGALQTDCFHGKGHAEIWATFQLMKAEKLSFGLETMQQAAGGRVDARYMEELIRQRTEAPPNLKHHAAVLRWDHARITTAEGPVAMFLEALRDPTADSDRVRALAKTIGDSLSGHGNARYLRDSAAVVREVKARLQERKKGLGVFPFGIPAMDFYGAEDFVVKDGNRICLDGRARMVSGAAPGEITVLTAVPGSGKTTFVANMALGWVEQKRRSLVGAWEQSASLTLELMAGISLGLERGDLREGRYTGEQEAQIGEECERIAEYIKFFELPFGRARGGKEFNDKNMDLIQQVVSDSGCSIFVADLFRRALKETNPDDEEQALYRMQSMAFELKVHLILVQQQKLKEIEQRPDKRPTRDNIKGSGGWVEVPDTIIGLHREALWKDVSDDWIEALVMKQRHGKWPQGVELKWNPATGKIGQGRTITVKQTLNDFDDQLAASQDPRRYRRRR